MPSREETLRVITDYLRAIEQKDADRARAALHPEITQHEYPNQLVKGGATRTRDAMLEGLAKGSKVLTGEAFELEEALVEGDRVACRIHWRGTLALDVLGKRSGEVLEARFGVFFRLKDGLVLEQHNYDCFCV